jgi:hypothetical protein
MSMTQDLPFGDEDARATPSIEGVSAGPVGTVFRNGGGELLLIPEAELRKVDEIGRELGDNSSRSALIECGHCGAQFEPRKGTGGRAQRFCSKQCRANFHAQRHDVGEPNRAERRSIVPVSANQHDERAATKDGWNVVLAAQAEISVDFNNDGDLLIRERDWPNDDVTILIRRENVGTFVDRLCDVIGIPGVP